MYASFVRGSKAHLAVLSSAVAFALVAGSAQAQGNQSLERKNMVRLGHTDLQGRPAYQPNLIQYPDGRWMLFVGMHNGAPQPAPGCPAGQRPNPLLPGSPCSGNGTMIVDVTNPNAPVEKFLIPAPPGGQSQMVRMCLGSQLPGGPPDDDKVYLQRNVQGGASAGYEVWDVTDVTAPVMVSELRDIRSTHKQWWECSTGITYLPGSKNANIAPGGVLWRQSQSMLVYDWSNPVAPPVFIRAFGLPGAEPGAAGPVPTSLHGPISAHDAPMAGQNLARGHDVIGNRIYAAWGVGDNGVMTIIDRKKLLPVSHGGTWVPQKVDSADNPNQEELIGPASATVGYYLMSPDQGGHTAWPVFGLKPPSYQRYNEFQTRDIVVLASEATADGQNGRCNEAPHWTFIVDVTVENSMAEPPGTRLQHDPYHGPMGLATMAVDPRFGERYPRGNYCGRGARFGVHSSEENFAQPWYGKLTAIAYFNGGLRVYDIREPHNPLEVAFYVPVANANTDPDGYMTNNTEIDDRGYIYIVDRNGAGMDILDLTGCARAIGVGAPGASCPRLN